MYFIHILFGILHVGVYVVLGMLWLAIGVVATKPLITPFYDSISADYSRPQEKEKAIRREVTGYYFVCAIFWPVAAIFGLCYVMTGTAPQVKDAEAAAAAKKLEDDMKKFEDMIRDWDPTDKLANAAAWTQDLVTDTVDAVKHGEVKDLGAQLLDEVKAATKDQVSQLRDELSTLKESIAKTTEEVYSVASGQRSTPSSRRRAESFDDFGFSRN